ncbi:M23 family metallopeptidase [Candidatus Microgenomates bacterium]|nr:M23 family metallopeptidase [Candidatus Microgenomates bacterium]
MKEKIQNLLPRKVFEGVALTQRFFNIKSRVPKRFQRLTIIITLLLFFFGYYPALTFPPVRLSTSFAQNQVQDGIIASSFPQPVVLPHPGYLSTSFSRSHPGVDIAAGLGMPIHPITAGTVEQVNFSFWGYGNHLIISHTEGFKSLYGHMGRIYIKKGQEVRSENIIGEVGLSGFTSGPHTHLEITKDGNYINPLTILPEIPDMPNENLAKK